MKQISSRQNHEIVAITKLSQAKERYKQNQFIAEGLRICSTLIKTNKLLQLYITEPLLDQAEQLTDASLITLVADEVMKKISQATTPSGILGVFALPKQPAPKELSGGIVLAGVSDPGNMGTLIRTCAAMDKKSVVVIEGVDPWNPKVIQASAGSIGMVNIFQWSWQELLKYKSKNILIGLIPYGGKTINAVTTKDVLFVIGSEAHGIPTEWQRTCDALISLAMPGEIESLNAGVAGSIVLYLAWAA
jgi:RNA methyltransferase, TrmH family